MSEDYYYYKARCQELENELAAVTRTMRTLEKGLNDVKSAIRNGSSDPKELLSIVSWTLYNWDK